MKWLAGRMLPSALDGQPVASPAAEAAPLVASAISVVPSVIVTLMLTSRIGCNGWQGPAGTPFESGTFELAISVPEAYPLVPPNIRYTTKIFHPNIHFKVWPIQTVWQLLHSPPDPGLASQCTGSLLSLQGLPSTQALTPSICAPVWCWLVVLLFACLPAWRQESPQHILAKLACGVHVPAGSA